MLLFVLHVPIRTNSHDILETRRDSLFESFNWQWLDHYVNGKHKQSDAAHYLVIPTTSFCPIPTSHWRPLHFLLVPIMEEQRAGFPVSQAGKEGTHRLVTRCSYLPSSPSLSALLATLRPVLRRCWEGPVAPPPHTRGRMCSQRCPLWACFYRMEAKQRF